MADNKDHLRYIGAAKSRNTFTGMPVEYVVPPACPVVVVQDMFSKDYNGGAEQTMDAIISKSPHRVFRMHSNSLTVDMLERYRDKYWIFGNFVNCDAAALAYLAESNIRYSVVEYDYKYCVFRSEVMHQQETKQPCDCPLRPHGILVDKFYSKAEHIFWMSEKQKEHFCSKVPSLLFVDEGKHVIQGSVFTDEDLDRMVSLRAFHEEAVKKFPVKIWGVQQSQNWIKGTEQTVKWCSQQKMPVKILGNLPYHKFLEEVASCYGLVFQPLDYDTCPRIVIEAKIMGCELTLNNNVQHKDEEWFTKSPDEIVSYLKSRGEFFWSHIKP